MTNYRDKLSKGIVWTALSDIFLSLSYLVVLAILSRVLKPSELGLVSLTIFITNFFTMINNFGLSQAIIRSKEITNDQLSSVFWLNLFFGFLLFVLVWFLARPIGDFFNSPLLGELLPVLGLSLALNVGSVQNSLLQKNLKFNSLAVCKIGGELVFSIITIVLALSGFKAMSIVYGLIARTVALSIFSTIAAQWIPGFVFSFSGLYKMMKFGVNVLGTNMLTFFGSNIDYLLIGKFLGPAALGFYTLAYQLISAPQQKISSVISKVTFPVFSKLQDDDVRLKKGYLKTIFFIALVTFPLLAGLFFFAPYLVKVLGSKWAPSIVPLQIMCVAGIFKSINTTVGSIFLSKGRPDLEFKWNILRLLIMSILIYFSLPWGIIGVSVIVTAFTVLATPVLQTIVFRLMGGNMLEYYRKLYVPAVCSGLMVAGISMAKPLFFEWQVPGIALQVLIGIIIYMTSLFWFYKGEFNETIGLVKGMFVNERGDQS